MRFEPSNTEAFWKRVKEEGSNGKRVFCYFFASEVKETGKSWCPDCVKAEPTISRVFSSPSADNVALLSIPVGLKETWRNPENIYRTDAKLQLKYVPTLVELGGVNCGEVKKTYVEAEIWENESSLL